MKLDALSLEVGVPIAWFDRKARLGQLTQACGNHASSLGIHLITARSACSPSDREEGVGDETEKPRVFKMLVDRLAAGREIHRLPDGTDVPVAAGRLAASVLTCLCYTGWRSPEKRLSRHD